jgi:hypothetical protein
VSVCMYYELVLQFTSIRLYVTAEQYASYNVKKKVQLSRIFGANTLALIRIPAVYTCPRRLLTLCTVCLAVVSSRAHGVTTTLLEREEVGNAVMDGLVPWRSVCPPLAEFTNSRHFPWLSRL